MGKIKQAIKRALPQNVQRAVEALSPQPFRAELKRADERSWSGAGPQCKVETLPGDEYPYTLLRVDSAGRAFSEHLSYGHLALGKLLTGYEFGTVLEIGSRNGTVARALQFLGKDLTTVDINPAYAATCAGEYLETRFPSPFEAIWCSHVLEHQRNVGAFCDKLFDDLLEGGVLAITVPSALSPLLLGHCSIFTGGHLLYHLVLAGFDCSAARLKCYDWQLSIIVRKKANGLRRTSVALSHHAPDSVDSDHRLLDFFPKQFVFTPAGHTWGELDSVNWGE